MIDEKIAEEGRTPAAVVVKYGLFGLLAGLSFLNFFAAAAIPKFRVIFMDMLGDKPLPFLTQTIVGNSTIFLALSIVIPVFAAATLFLSRPRMAASILAVLNVVVVLQIAATVAALFMPLTTIVTAMNAP